MSAARVLVVDDTPANLKLASMVMERAGYQVEKAVDAEEALAVIARTPPDLILMDIALPGMDGLTLTRQLKADAATRDIRIVAMTAFAMKGDDEKALAAGCDGYISKPINTRTLSSQVAALLPPVEAGAMNVLIVDDIESNRKLLRAILRTRGVNVFEANDGLQALEILEREPVDAIISDILMPHMDGYRLCYEVRRSARHHALPFIVWTSTYTSSSDESLARAMGADRFLHKPVSPEAVFEALEEVGQRSDRPRPLSEEPIRDLELMKDYSARLVSKLEEQNADLRRRTAELEASEAKFRDLFVNAHDLIVMTASDGALLFVNPAFEKALGHSAQETPRLSIRDIIHPDSRHGFMENFQRVAAGKNVGLIETTFVTREGAPISVEGNCNCGFKDGQPATIRGIFRDVTARKQAEEAVRESGQRLQSILDTMFVFVGLLTLDGRIVEVNHAPLEAAGLKREEVLGQSVAETFWFSHSPAVREQVRQALSRTAQGEVVREDFLIQIAGGRIITIDATFAPLRDAAGCVSQLVGSAVDITTRKQAEEALRQTTALRDAILNSASYGIIASGADRHIHTFNRAAEQMLGYSAEEMMGQSTVPFHDPDEVAERARELSAQLGRPIPPGPEVFTLIPQLTGRYEMREWTYIRKDGSRFPVELAVGPLLNAENQPIGYVGIASDITARKQAEAHGREKEEAERANRAKSEFLSRMSHELRTPLHAILGFAQLLEMENQSPGDAESVAHIVRAGKHLLGLINEVLDIARVESGQLALTPEPVSVRETLEEALSLVKPQAAERGVRLEPLTGELDCEVLSSAQRLMQVVLNLVSNAVKFNREGGAVAVSCEKTGDCVRIKVADTGRGISAADISKLFVPFERLNVDETLIEGTGLGLSLSRYLVEAMGGKIDLESALGQGSTFWVELPLVQGTSAATARSLAAHSRDVVEGSRSTAPRTILYIEDNLSNLRLIERILARRPEVKLISAMRGSLGLELARQHQPDLVLLDLHLPDIQGDEILRQLRADPHTDQIPIVIISADATALQIGRLRAAGVNDYLTKPIDVRRFLALIDATQPRRPELVSQ